MAYFISLNRPSEALLREIALSPIVYSYLFVQMYSIFSSLKNVDGQSCRLHAL